MNGIAFTAPYVHGPLLLGMCGERKNATLIHAFASGDSSLESGVRKVILALRHVPEYYEIIAGTHHLRVLSKKVAEAYWIGSDLLKKTRCRLKHAPLCKKPHHNWTVIVGLDHANLGPMEKLLVDDCLVHAGVIIRVNENTVVVSHTPLIKTGAKFSLGAEQEKLVRRDFIGDAVVGDIVSYHLGFGAQKLTRKQTENLAKWTDLAIAKFNSQ